MSQKRKKALAFGALGETIGAILLMLKGYRIVARGFRRPVGEIDLVARRGKNLVFIEIKARGTAEQARAAISKNQRTRIMRAAEAYIQEHPNMAHLDIRFDALLVIRGHFPVHIVDAWRPGD